MNNELNHCSSWTPKTPDPCLSEKIRYRILPRFSREIVKLVRARSLLYRSRILQPNSHFSAFFEIYSRPYRAKKKCEHFSSPEKKENIWRRRRTLKSQHRLGRRSTRSAFFCTALNSIFSAQNPSIVKHLTFCYFFRFHLKVAILSRIKSVFKSILMKICRNFAIFLRIYQHIMSLLPFLFNWVGKKAEKTTPFPSTRKFCT